MAIGALGVLASLLAGPGPAAAAPRAEAAPGPVVLLGTGGLRWDDVGDNPALSALLEDSAGLLAVRSVRSTTCPADGWLAVSSGRRASDTPAEPARAGSCRVPAVQVPAPGGPGTVARWADYRAAADDESFDADPGLLGATLAAGNKTTAAVGPGAAIALAGRDGTAPVAFTGPVDDDKGTVDPNRLADDVQAALARHPDVLAVDLGTIRDPAQAPTGLKLTGAYAASREQQVQRLDTRLGLVLGQLPQTATVLVASLADAGDTSQLRLLAARGPAPDGASYGESLLVSSSTRQDGIAQTTDLAPTVLAALDVRAPDGFVGAPIRPVAGGDVVDRLQRLQDLDQAAIEIHPIVPWFFNGIVVAQVLLYGLAALVLRRDGSDDDSGVVTRRRRRTLGSVRRIAVVFATVPAATYLANLVPWWRNDVPGLVVTGAVVLFATPMAVLALAGPWRSRVLGPMGIVAGLTALVLAADVATGSHLMLSSLMGVQPVIAGRWYGFSNPGFALFATGALLLAVAVADLVADGRDDPRERRKAAGAVVAIGLVAVVVDGSPGLGADFGGPPAIIPAFGVLALLVAGVAVTWRRALVIAVVTVGALALLSVGDWLRPAESRTHLGAFVQTLVDGDAWPVVQRKLEQNLQILFGSWLSALLPVAVAFVVFVLWRPGRLGVRPLEVAYQRTPMLRHGLVAFGVLIAIGFALNDSGTVIPAVAATVAIPLLIAASVRAMEEADEERLAAAVARTRRPPAKPRR